MNLNELYRQAQQLAWDEPVDLDAHDITQLKGFSQQVREKFALLIIQECVQLADMYESDYLGDIIKQHFGIEG